MTGPIHSISAKERGFMMRNTASAHRFWGRMCLCLLAFCCLLAAGAPVAGALSYQYDRKDKAVPAPDGYACVRQARSDQAEKGANWDPTDLFIDEDGLINVLDSDMGRIHVYDRELHYLSTLSFTEEGAEAFLMGISGLYVDGKGDDKTYYVADPERERVFIADAKGAIVREILRPDTELIDQSVTFAPTKVQLDKNGNLYVLVPGIYMGACVFSAKDDFAFLTFIGSNPVEATAFLLADYFWKQVLNQNQIDSMKRYVPVSFENFTLDAEGYLYTVTNKTSLGTQFTDEIKKFNTNSLNILPHQDYGDLELGKTNDILQDTSYVDIAVNEGGYMAALDANLCRVAVFNQNGDRLFTFGERNNTVGGFDTLTALDVFGSDIYILDQNYETISLFRPTAYGRDVLAAADLFGQGHYTEAEPLWRKVIGQNGGFSLAYVGLGKALLEQGDFQGAMEYFRQGNDRDGYSQAFSQYRAQGMQTVFVGIFAAVFLLFILLLVAERRLKVRSNYLVNPIHKSLAGKVRYTLFHPGEGGYVLARHTDVKKTGIFSLCVLGVWFFASVVDWQYSGFIFNPNNPEEFEVLFHLLKTFGLFALWVVAGWFVSNLMDSSARLTDLTVVSATALLPYITGVLLHTAASNLLAKEEGGFLTAMQVILILWSAAILIGGFREIHEMSFRGALLSILFTLLGILLILFMALLLWSLFQQVFVFFAQLWDEIIKMIG